MPWPEDRASRFYVVVTFLSCNRPVLALLLAGLSQSEDCTTDFFVFTMNHGILQPRPNTL